MATVEQWLGALSRMDYETEINMKLGNGRTVALSPESGYMAQEGFILPSMEGLDDRPTVAKLLDSASKCLKTVQAWDGATNVWKYYENSVKAVAQASLAFEDLHLGLPYGQLKLPLPDEKDEVKPGDVCWLCVTGLDTLRDSLRETINVIPWDVQAYKYAAVTAYQCLESAASVRWHIGRGTCRDDAARMLYELELQRRDVAGGAMPPDKTE